MNEGGLAIWMTWSRALVVAEEKIEELKNRRIDNLKNWDLNLGFESRCWNRTPLFYFLFFFNYLNTKNNKENRKKKLKRVKSTFQVFLDQKQ